MAALPYMQLYVADYLADTAHLTTEEHGAYLLLLFSYWQTGKPLRGDRLASVSRMGAERWASVEPTLKEFFHVKSGVWTHFRVESDLEKVGSKSKKNSEAGKASARAKALARQALEESESTNVGTVVVTNVEQTYQRNVNHTRSGDTDTDTDTDTEADQDQDQKLSSSGSKKPKKPKSLFELPAWVNKSSWNGFLEMRKKIKKPLTENGMGLAIGKLEKLVHEGNNPNDVLDQSTFNSWQGLFAIKEEFKNGTNTGTSGKSRSSLVDRVRQANAHLYDDEPPAYVDDREWPEFDGLREVDGQVVGSDDRDVWP